MKLLVALSVLLAVVSAKPGQSHISEGPVPWAGFPGGDQPCYTTPSNGKDGGICLQTDCCEGSLYISNLCPAYQANVRCCYSSNKCNTGTGTSTGTVQSTACEILSMHEKKQIALKGEHFNSLGNNPYDGASALSNIRDTCYGKQAKRSSYCCTEGCSPGGYVGLTSKMLISLRDYAKQYYASTGLAIQVSALAGSCHSTTSKHYQGTTWDIACTTPTNHCSSLTTWCRNQNPVELCYPGGPCSGHDTWVHCAH